jgi:hypothetical protein
LLDEIMLSTCCKRYARSDPAPWRQSPTAGSAIAMATRMLGEGMSRKGAAGRAAPHGAHLGTGFTAPTAARSAKERDPSLLTRQVHSQNTNDEHGANIRRPSARHAVVTRKGIEASGGRIRARDLPGEGCVFIIDLPRMSVA